MHLRSVHGALRCADAVNIDRFRTLGRVDLEITDANGKELMIVSRQHFELNPARDGGSCTIRALHANAIRVLRGGEANGIFLSKGGDARQVATLRPGDMIEVGDVRGLHPLTSAGQRFVVMNHGNRAGLPTGSFAQVPQFRKVLGKKAHALHFVRDYTDLSGFQG